MFPGPAFLLAADMPQNVVLPRSGYRYPCWALGGHVGPMLGHVVPVLNLCWAKNGVFLEAIWGLGWAYAGGKRLVCWGLCWRKKNGMLGSCWVKVCGHVGGGGELPGNPHSFHTSGTLRHVPLPICFAAMLLHVRYLTWQFCFQCQHGYVQALGKLFKTKNGG